MRINVVLFLCIIEVALSYTDLDDSFDFDSMVNNSDSLKKMLDCFFDRVPCDAVLQHYKNHITETLKDACAECTPLQKHHYHQFLNGTQHFFPQDYKQYMQKFGKNPKPNEMEELEKEISKY